MATRSEPAPLVLQERLSYLESHTKTPGVDYAEAKTPVELEDGALVPGGALQLCSIEALALLTQYFAIGIIYGMIPRLSLPVFNNYLNLEGYQASAYDVLVTLGWSFKIFYGMLSDCVPMFGYRRKPYMLIGWVATAICLAVMAFSPFDTPFCDRRVYECPMDVSRDTVNASVAKYYNFDAPDGGTKFIVLSAIVCFGYVMADVAADAMVVQYAQREPLAIRGRTQTAIYMARYTGSMLAYFCIGFMLNGKVYGGSFEWTTTPNVMYGICLVPCVIAVISTFFFLVEVKTESTPFSKWIADFWGLLQKRVMWQICAFKFINQVFQSIGATPTTPISRAWAGVTPLNESLSNVLSSLIMVLVMGAVAKWGLHWNWRWTIAISSVAVVAIDAFVVFFTIWNVFRNQWFFNGVALAENVPTGIRFIIATYCAVEVADIGNEGATYGLITTVNNLASPFSQVIYKVVDSYFDVSQKDIARDDTHVRWEVSYCFFISYAAKMLALVWLFMLPPQKEAMQVLKKKGGSSALAGSLLIVVFMGTLSFSVVTSFMTIFPSTKCYRIAGGKGFKPDGTCI
ncbi:Folate-Biopterin Transporter (FBT) Family [Achlya hypogyna]|uniref:Folate-Biopterin Transporter (FBT) Family n=1 Tax=Achlya hypogyna TaxID=1202772 RepID=A0A1V9Z4B4_ACHHY|nr:Folate-Biopterin Transporter (FBT) Family [Achlya hypogyna]